MIIFYQDQFFPAGHIDQGKPIPLGLLGQLGTRPHHLSKQWLEYKKLMLELDFAGYSASSRNGDDPIQAQLRAQNYTLTDLRSFAELYSLGLARLGLDNSAPSGLLEHATVVVERGTALVAAYNHFRQEYQQLTHHHSDSSRDTELTEASRRVSW